MKRDEKGNDRITSSWYKKSRTVEVGKGTRGGGGVGMENEGPRKSRIAQGEEVDKIWRTGKV